MDTAKRPRLATALIGITLTSLVGVADVSAQANASDADRVEIRVSLSSQGNDISFDQTALQVPLGVDVRLEFENKADVGSGITHNVVVLKPGSIDAVIARLRAAEYDLTRMQDDPDIIRITATLPPGESDAVTFHPEASGFYPYICLMPGHGDILDMRGLLSVVE